MPKIAAYPPLLPKDLVTREGVTVKVKKAELRENVQTSIGIISKALVLYLDVGGEEYSYLFSLDREVIAGSAGRLIASIAGVDDTSKLTAEALKKFNGKTVKVVKRGDKLYWYP
jgi:hypothetical protein